MGVKAVTPEPEPEPLEGGTRYAKLKPRRGSSADAVAEHQRARIRRALIELVAEDGYEAVKVTELARRARISTRDFYQRCDGKQGCLLEAHDWLIAAAVRRLTVAIRGGRDAEERARLVLEELVEMLVAHPVETRFVCLDAAAGGIEILERKSRAAEDLAALVGLCLGGPGEDSDLPVPLTEGIALGVAQVVRSYVIGGRLNELPSVVGDLCRWIADLAVPQANLLERLQPPPSAEGDRAAAALCFSRVAEADVDRGAWERLGIQAATLTLAGEDGYWQLSVPRIRAAVGISRARFDAHYADVDGCFADAIGLVADRVMDFTATTAAHDDEEWPVGFHHAVEALCAYAATEPRLARLALVEFLSCGPEGVREISELTQGFAERLRAGVPPADVPPSISAEASMGAVLGLVQRSVVGAHADRIATLAPYLSYLALAPAIGPQEAIAAIRTRERSKLALPSASA